MTYRRTWFSYVLGAAYAVVSILLLSVMGAVWFLRKLGSEVGSNGFLEYNSWWELAVAPVALISLLVVVHFIVGEISLAARKRWTMQENTASLWEAVAVILIFILGFFYRMNVWLHTVQAISDTGVIDVAYYEKAVVRAGESVAPMAYGAGYLYVLCLSGMLSFLGNKIMSAVFFQLVLQMISMILAYAVVRKIAGRLPACAALLCLAFGQNYVQTAEQITPECFVFLLYLAGMLVTVSFVKEYCSNRMRKSSSVVYAVLAGIVLGVLSYLDLMLASLGVFLAGLFIGKKTKRVDKRKYTSPTFNIIVFLITLAAGAVTWTASAYGYAGYRGVGFAQSVDEWLSAQPVLSRQWDGINAVYQFGTYETAVFVVIVALASFLVFELFKKEKEQNYMLWIVAWAFIAPLPLLGSAAEPYRLESLFIWIVLAGVGLQNCLFGGRPKVMQAVIEGINAGAAAIEANERQNQEKENGQAAEASPDEAQKTPTAVEGTENLETAVQDMTQNVAESGQPEKEDALEMIQLDEEPPKAEKPRYIENPLPLPKKHVKKEMDYQYPVDEKDMKYDIEVDENDDFDI